MSGDIWEICRLLRRGVQDPELEVPEIVYTALATRMINEFLHTSYRLEEVAMFPPLLQIVLDAIVGAYRKD